LGVGSKLNFLRKSMPVVLVHGNPENTAIWSDLIPYLGRDDVTALSPPGFGAEVPPGFGATADEYRDWLAAELARMDGPIDLVGHDWGGLLVLRIAMELPQIVRSWATDVAGGFDPEYVWHDMARVWQTPGEGEQSVRRIAETPVVARARRYESLGMSGATAAKIAGGFNEVMGRCILSLYRSAAQPAMAKWGERLHEAACKPGLVIIATEDHLVGGEVLARRSAEKCGASVAVLRGLGHWWMSQAPERGAGVLTGFWASLGGRHVVRADA
jgi:pimeloyl-ACP methyl ester carboxylesterase